MRTGFYLCGCPEAVLINLIGIEMSRFYGLRVQGSCGTADAKRPDFQAGVEAAMTGVACAAAGAEVLLFFGLLDGATIVSPAKTVLDSDAMGMIRRLVRRETVDASTALYDDIREVGIGGHFLGRRSTRAFARAGELWQPRLFQREPFDVCAQRSLHDAAIERAEDIMATHAVPPLSDDVERHIAEGRRPPRGDPRGLRSRPVAARAGRRGRRRGTGARPVRYNAASRSSSRLVESPHDRDTCARAPRRVRRAASHRHRSRARTATIAKRMSSPRGESSRATISSAASPSRRFAASTWSAGWSSTSGCGDGYRTTAARALEGEARERGIDRAVGDGPGAGVLHAQRLHRRRRRRRA